MKRFLILQLRPEKDASDGEFAAFLDKGGLREAEVHRICLDQEPLPADLRLEDYAGVIVGGGPGCVSDDPATKDPIEARIEADILSLMPEVTDRDMPFMGCCYGIGILGHHLGAEVSKRRYGEPVGPVTCSVVGDDPLIADLPRRFDAFVGHKEAMQELPEGCTHLLASDPCPFQMVRYKDNVYATQFHPEADGGVFENRINIYRHRGYFDPDQADELIAKCHAADVTVPVEILRRFVERYRAT